MTLQKLKASPTTFDGVRATRMGGYGFCFYGPYQHFWYGLLDRYFPTKSLPHFGTKVSAPSLSIRYTPLSCKKQSFWLILLIPRFLWNKCVSHCLIAGITSHIHDG